MTSTEVTFRRATPADTRPAFDVSMASMRDLFARQGNEWKLDPESFWTMLEPFLTHLAAHAAEWWVATTDVRGLRRYYAAGTVARFAMASLAAPPKPARSAGNLVAVRATLEDLPDIAAIEEAVFGYPRHADYPWLFAHRESYVYRRSGRTVGFAFFSETGQGPIAALEAADLPTILLHLEAQAHARGMESISFEVPTINEVAMQHLLGRGFKIDAPLNLLMSNVPFGKFDRLVAFAPAIVL